MPSHRLVIMIGFCSHLYPPPPPTYVQQLCDLSFVQRWCVSDFRGQQEPLVSGRLFGTTSRDMCDWVAIVNGGATFLYIPIPERMFSPDSSGHRSTTVVQSLIAKRIFSCPHRSCYFMIAVLCANMIMGFALSSISEMAPIRWLWLWEAKWRTKNVRKEGIDDMRNFTINTN